MHYTALPQLVKYTALNEVANHCADYPNLVSKINFSFASLFKNWNETLKVFTKIGKTLKIPCKNS